MESLLRKAQKFDQGRPVIYEISAEELELFLAFLQGDITYRQVYLALGRSYGYASNWVKRCTAYMYQRQMITINYNNQIHRWKPKTYAVPGFQQRPV